MSVALEGQPFSILQDTTNAAPTADEHVGTNGDANSSTKDLIAEDASHARASNGVAKAEEEVHDIADKENKHTAEEDASPAEEDAAIEEEREEAHVESENTTAAVTQDLAADGEAAISEAADVPAAEEDRVASEHTTATESIAEQEIASESLPAEAEETMTAVEEEAGAEEIQTVESETPADAAETVPLESEASAVTEENFVSEPSEDEPSVSEAPAVEASDEGSVIPQESHISEADTATEESVEIPVEAGPVTTEAGTSAPEMTGASEEKVEEEVDTSAVDEASVEVANATAEIAMVEEASPLTEQAEPAEEPVAVEEAVPVEESAHVEDEVVPEEPVAVEEAALAAEVPVADEATPSEEIASTEEVASAPEVAVEEEAAAAEASPVVNEVPSTEEPAAVEEVAIASTEPEPLAEEPIPAEESGPEVAEEIAQDEPVVTEEVGAEEESPAVEEAAAANVVNIEESSDAPGHATEESVLVEEPIVVEEAPVEEPIAEEEAGPDESVAVEEAAPTEEPAASEEAISTEEPVSVEEAASIEELVAEETILNVLVADEPAVPEPAPEVAAPVEESVAIEEAPVVEPTVVDETEASEESIVASDAVAEDTIAELEEMTFAEPPPEKRTVVEEESIVEPTVAEEVASEGLTTEQHAAIEEQPAAVEEQSGLSEETTTEVTSTEELPEVNEELESAEGAPVSEAVADAVSDEATLEISREATDEVAAVAEPIDNAEEGVPEVNVAGAVDDTSVQVILPSEDDAEVAVQEESINVVPKPEEDIATVEEQHVPDSHAVDVPASSEIDESSVNAEFDASAEVTEDKTTEAVPIEEPILFNGEPEGVTEDGGALVEPEGVVAIISEESVIHDAPVADNTETIAGETVGQHVPEPEGQSETIIEELVVNTVEEAGVVSDAPAITVDVPEVEADGADAGEEEITTSGALQATEVERPKSPWTPSYSVTMQGPGVGSPDVTEDVGEIAELEQLPPLAVEVPSTEVTETAIEVPEIETTTVDVTSGELEPTPSEVNIVVTESAQEEDAPAETAADDVEVPKSPSWIPSYSVSSQGASPLQSPKAVAAEENELETVEPLNASHIPSVVVDAAEESLAEVEHIEQPGTEASGAVGEATSVEIVVQPAVEGGEQTEEIPIVQTTESDVSEVDASAPSSAALHEDIDRAKSASWIPSYSVNSQGASPLHMPQPTEDGDVDELQPLAASVADVIAESPAAEVQAISTEEVETAVQEAASVPEDPSESIVVPQVILTPELVEPTPEDPSQVSVDTSPAAALERPKSPWTPSYTVTQQGTSPLNGPISADDKDLDEVEHLPAPLVNGKADVKEEILAEADTTYEAVDEDTVVSSQAETANEQPTVVVETVADTEEEQTTIAEERPERPWTPSYSVTTQGPGTPTAEAGSKVDEDGPQVFPTVDSAATESKKVAAKPSLARLAPVDENEQINIGVDSQLQPGSVSPTTTRTRLESTTSSRFFPGGWFSSTAKLPEEGRTSDEHAEGEFSKSPTSAADSPALDVPTNTPTDGVIDEKKRSRWCLIM